MAKRDDDELPGEPLMAGRVKMVEGNDPKAEPLEQIASSSSAAKRAIVVIFL